MNRNRQIFFAVFFIVSLNLVFTLNASGDEYIIKQNDVLKTYVFDNPDLNVNTNVPPDGVITFPLVGEINVLGMSSQQLSEILQERLEYYLIDPKVSVFVTAYNPLNVYLLGAFKQAGALTYKPGNRLTDYISEAGGFLSNADLKNCYIYPLNREEEKREINLKELLEESEGGDIDIELEPFDTVYLPEKSGFLFTEWRDVADAVNIVVGLLTLYIVLSRE